MMSFFIFFMFLLIVCFLMNFYSFLNSLLLLESMSLILFFSCFFALSMSFSFKFLLYYFVFIVSESAMGLSILVLAMKFFGSGMFSSMVGLKF